MRAPAHRLGETDGWTKKDHDESHAFTVGGALATMAGTASPRALTTRRDTGAIADESQPPQKGQAPRPAEDDASADQDIALVSRFAQLGAFANLQRQLVGIDFAAVSAARRAVEQSAGLRLPGFWATQDLVTKHFAGSIDFPALTSALKGITESATISGVVAVQRQWADSLAKSIHFPALEKAFTSSAALAALAQSNTELLGAVTVQGDVLRRIAEGIQPKLPTIEFARWLENLGGWLPANLRDVEDLEVVATLALDEGLPLSWVPRAEIVNELTSADSEEERQALLERRREEVLDDCEQALASFSGEWALQCRSAIQALRVALDGPAQSHASNIVDSVVLALHGKQGRDNAKARAQEDWGELPLGLAAENLTLRPLFRAFATWYPSSGLTPPEHFARHATSHAVGHAGVFAPRSALIAVMLATSLTVQYTQTAEPDGE